MTVLPVVSGREAVKVLKNSALDFTIKNEATSFFSTAAAAIYRFPITKSWTVEGL